MSILAPRPKPLTPRSIPHGAKGYFRSYSMNPETRVPLAARMNGGFKMLLYGANLMYASSTHAMCWLPNFNIIGC